MRLLTALLSATLPLLAAGQVQLLPAGEFAARDGRPGPGKCWKVDDAQGARLAAAINAEAALTPVVIDYEHQTLAAADNGQPAPAAGWIKSTEWRPGQGLFANVEWTAAAKARIDAGEYRYISPVITSDKDGVVIRVLMAALTNFPALLGMDAVVAQLNARFNTAPPTPTQENTDMNLLASLLAALALPATTTEADALSAVSALRATAAAAGDSLKAMRAELGVDAQADQAAALTALKTLKTQSAAAAGGDAQVTALTAQVTALSTQIATLTAQAAQGQADKVVAEVDGAIAAGKLAAAARDSFLAWGKSDPAAMTAALKAMPVIEGLKGQSAAAGAGKAAEGGGTAALSAQQSAIAAQLGIDPKKYAEQLAAAAA